MSLHQSDLASLSQLGKELKSALKEVIDNLPNRVQSISGMSEHLNYNRSNCQRLLNATSKNKEGIEVISLLPGITSLTEFCEKSTPYIEAKENHKLQHLIEEFQRQIKLHARSHSELKRILSSYSDVNSEQKIVTKKDKQARLYEAAKELIGASIDTLFCSYILSNSTKNKDFLQETAMISKLGNTHEKFAPPFVQFYTHPHPNDFVKPSLITADSITTNDGFSIGIVDEYSSDGLFDAYASYSPSNSGIVFDDFSENKPFNATFLFDNPDELANPITHQSHCSSTSLSIRNPTKKLVMLVFLDKAIDMRSTVNVGCYQGNQKVDDGHLKASDMWTERLPSFPDLKIVNLLSPNISSSSSLNIVELTDYQFKFAQLDKQNFVCYMMEINYPIWTSTYRIYFEHS
jgi:hypothetical protein